MGKLFFLWSFLFVSPHLFASTHYCFFPGAGGLKSYIANTIQERLHNAGIPFVPFSFTKKFTVKERAQEAVDQMEEIVRREPDFKCHLLGYSMGGVVARYVANYGEIVNAFGEIEPISRRFITMASISSPHRGTPLADFLRRNYPGLHPGVDTLSEAEMFRFNVEGSEDYSPVVEGIPFYSYETFVLDREEISSSLGKIGFQYMTRILKERGDETLNDGLVPKLSMEFGALAGTYQIPHEFMTKDIASDIVTAYSFLVHHWESMLNKVRDKVDAESFQIFSLARFALN